MIESTYDILIVGAGPAGASAAAAAADQKCRVLMVDRRKKVGVPVQCAELIPAQLVGELKLGRDYVVQPTRGMKTFLGDREVKETNAAGFMIRRDRFDQTLVNAASKRGAQVLLETKAVSRSGQDVVIHTKGKAPQKITASIIIGADGPLSTVARWIGVARPELISTIQVRVPLKEPMDFTEVYFDPAIYCGYAWLFPRGNQANLGLGVKRRNGVRPPLHRLLDLHLSRCRKAGKIEDSRSKPITAWVPAGPAATIVHVNVMLAGDAAGQTHPITGAGIFPAVAAGRMAGTWAATALQSRDLSCLRGYDAEYRDLFGHSTQRAVARQRLLESRWDDLDEILKYCWVAFKEYYAPI